MRKVILNHVFAGSFWKENIGFEFINFFKSDDGHFYYYVTPYGYVRKKIILEKGDLIINAITISDDTISILSYGFVDEDLVSKFNPSYNLKSKDFTSEVVEGKKLKEIQQNLSKNISYKKVKLAIFFPNKKILPIYVTAKMGDTYLYSSRKDMLKVSLKDLKNNNPIKYKTRKRFFGEGYANNMIFDVEKDVEYFQELLKKEKKNFSKNLSLSDVKNNFLDLYKHENINLLSFSKKIYDEGIISNLIFSFCNSSKALKRRLLHFFSLERKGDVYREISIIDLQTVTRKSTKNPPNGRIDIALVDNNNKIAIIENKIKASLTSDKKYGEQITKYREAFPDSVMFILKPNYYEINPNVSIILRKNNVNSLDYNDFVKHVFRHCPRDFPNNEYEIMFKQFRQILQVHGQSVDNEYFNNSISYFEEKTK